GRGGRSSLASAEFALYVWHGASTATTLKRLPKGLGTMCFPSPITPLGLPQPLKKWNNTRFHRLGTPDFPSTPAPSRVVSLHAGVSHALTVTFQGIIRDDGSRIPQGLSVTNAIALRVR